MPLATAASTGSLLRRRAFQRTGVLRPLLIWLVVAAALAAKPPPAASSGSVELAPDSFRLNALALLNDERAALGVPPLEENGELDDVAVERALDMAAGGYFAHVSPSGGSAEQLLSLHGVGFGRMGENITRSNEPSNQVVHVAHQAQMMSPPHRDNMLDARFNRVGIGVAQVDGTYYFAVVFAD
ncbi:MAG: CAP domain-containing protein [Dehalococcoidia bacterium]